VGSYISTARYFYGIAELLVWFPCAHRCYVLVCSFHKFLVRDAFVRTNHYAIAMMFICLSVHMHCDHTVHVGMDLSLWWDSSMFWAPWHQGCPHTAGPFLSTPTLKSAGVWINAN